MMYFKFHIQVWKSVNVCYLADLNISTQFCKMKFTSMMVRHIYSYLLIYSIV